jgi:basic membrane protein A
MQKMLPNVQMKIVENVNDSDPNSATVFRQLAQDGNQVIFANGFGYQQVLPDLAKEFPNVIFIQQEANLTGPNLGSFWGRLEEARYVQGVLAGKMTKSGMVGFIGGFPVPPVLSGVNAFALGLKAANPNAKLQVLWPNSWYDPPKEKEGTDALINAGADIIAYHGDDATTLQAAAARGKWGMTSNADLSSAAPDAFLSGSTWNWGPYFTRTIKAIANKTWKPEFYMGDLKDGTVMLAPYGSAVTADAKQAAEQAKTDIINGKIKIFQGPIKDQDGNVKVPDGSVASDDLINNTDWLVQGIIGSPK